MYDLILLLIEDDILIFAVILILMTIIFYIDKRITKLETKDSNLQKTLDNFKNSSDKRLTIIEKDIKRLLERK